MNHPAPATRSQERAPLSKYVFWGLWFVLAPALLAFGALHLFDRASPDKHGVILDFVREQRVPAAIVLFTLFEMVLYSFRHHLPLASLVGVAGHVGLDVETRKGIEAAIHLIDETERVLARHKEEVAAGLSSAVRQEIETALARLKSAVQGSPFDRAAFKEAFARASELVEGHLGGWRKGEMREYAESIGIAILVALLLRAVVVEAFKIPSGSMLPTLQIGDHIFVNKFIYGPTVPLLHTRLFPSLPPKRGDVIVFEYPEPDLRRERQDFIKRVIAIPGDVLEVDGGHPIINGWRIPNCKAGHYVFSETPGGFSHAGDLYVEFLDGTAYLALYDDAGSQEKEGPYYVKPGEVWVLGDNRHNSSDSRRWHNNLGAGVPFANIKGRAMFVWYPLGRLMVNVMGRPQLPREAEAEIVAGIDRCLGARPKDAETIPPPPPAAVPDRPGPGR